MMNLAIDFSEVTPQNLKVLDEKETKRNLINYARMNGFEAEMRELYDKFEKMHASCHNEKEKKDIAKLLALEIYRLLGDSGDLYVDNEIVFKEQRKENIGENFEKQGFLIFPK